MQYQWKIKWSSIYAVCHLSKFIMTIWIVIYKYHMTNGNNVSIKERGCQGTQSDMSKKEPVQLWLQIIISRSANFSNKHSPSAVNITHAPSSKIKKD